MQKHFRVYKRACTNFRLKISDLNRFAKFSTRAPDPDKKNFVDNLMGHFQKKLSISSKNLHRWHLRGGVFREKHPPLQAYRTISEVCLKTLKRKEIYLQNSGTKNLQLICAKNKFPLL